MYLCEQERGEILYNFFLFYALLLFIKSTNHLVNTIFHFIVSNDLGKKGLANLLVKLSSAFVPIVIESFF